MAVPGESANDKPIEELGLTLRTLAMLREHTDVRTAGQLAEWIPSRLLELPYLQETDVVRAEKALYDLGLPMPESTVAADAEEYSAYRERIENATIEELGVPESMISALHELGVRAYADFEDGPEGLRALVESLSPEDAEQFTLCVAWHGARGEWVLGLPIASLMLMPRAANVLERNTDIRTLGELVAWAPDELLELRNMTRGSVENIENELDEYDLRLQGSDYPELRQERLDAERELGARLQLGIEALGVPAAAVSGLHALGVYSGEDLDSALIDYWDEIGQLVLALSSEDQDALKRVIKQYRWGYDGVMPKPRIEPIRILRVGDRYEMEDYQGVLEEGAVASWGHRPEVIDGEPWTFELHEKADGTWVFEDHERGYRAGDRREFATLDEVADFIDERWSRIW